tara:strand:+ start:1177 stop:2271 length:1095 start_codon:yes stop_codon:yes gene_type:complete
MSFFKFRSYIFALSSLCLLLIYPFNLSAKAASSLAAWSLTRNGVLYLRTSTNSKLKAFFQSSDDQKGNRVWIDFPGELSKPRSIKGTGPIKEIRLGKPKRDMTRLVIEFNPNVFLEPSKLRLEGITPDKWKLRFSGVSTLGLKTIGEGNLEKQKIRQYSIYNQNDKISILSKYSSLPNLQTKNLLVVIDPGHGGPDSGAVGLSGLKESNVVLDISLQVARLLERKGIKVRLTRSREVDLDLPPRVAFANRLRADAFISIHANATRKTRKDVNGIETFYYYGRRGFRLSELIQSEVLKVSKGSPDRGVRKGRFFVIRRTNMPAALVETGFVTGKLDGYRLAKSSHRKNLSYAIATGIMNYLLEEY